MSILDSDHVAVLKYTDGRQCSMLTDRMGRCADQDFATTPVTVEEQMRGWLAVLRRRRDVHLQVPAYRQLTGLVDFFAGWRIVPFDARAADEFDRLRKQRIRIGTMDLKIAAIARVHQALLLSSNLRDFEKVPGLQVENWLR